MEKNSSDSFSLEVRNRVAGLRVEQRADETPSRTIVGYAAVFDSWSDPINGWFKEKIDRHAFDDCDMSDVIMLDAIYRQAAVRRPPQTFVLFTGDGHFQPAVRYLTQDLGNRVVLYGIRGTISRALREAATEVFEVPEDDSLQWECFQYIVADFDRIALNHSNSDPFATFHSLVTRVSNKNRVPKERVELAVSEMVNRGWVTRKKHRVSYDKPMINVLIPECDELIAVGLFKP